MSVTELILNAVSNKNQSMNLVVGSLPQVRSLSGWSIVRQSPFLISEWNVLVKTLLNNQQMELLEQKSEISGEAMISGNRIGFVFLQTDDIMKIWLNLELDISKQNAHSHMPLSLVEHAAKNKGLVVLASSQISSLMGLATGLITKMNEEKTFSAVIFANQAFPKIRENKAIFVYSQIPEVNRYTSMGLTAGVDVALFFGYSDAKSFETAIELSEQGVSVFFAMVAPSSMNAIRRGICFSEQSFGRHGKARFVESLKMVAQQENILGLGGETVMVHEMMPFNVEMKKLLEEENLESLEQILKNNSDFSGIMSMNQALLSQLIKRKIDIKSAFEATRDPEHLDQLLKKVGI